ncbi:Heat shock protein beta-1 [Caligus rogercresseyi]|uniref:Heat shock protein beta-1 n=2 Tax=Caligus rogercresseyi TaxID=217165 RepID=A0A7T8KLW2_CALRO|nr:Heat shock protein beta-1 [Caligus rogercresseyi]
MSVENGSRVPVTLRDHFWNDPFFSSTWDDFHKVQEQMMKRSQEMFQKFHEDQQYHSYSMQSHSSNSDKKDSTEGSSSSMMSTEKKESSSSNKGGNDSITCGKGNDMFTSHKGNGMFSSNMNDEMSSSNSRSMFNDSGMNGDYNPWFLSRSNEFGKDLNIFQDKDEQVIRIKDEEDKFEISLDTHSYRPDELKVNIKDGVISIEAKHEEKSEDGSKFVSKQFVRKYTLPKNTKPEQVNSNLSSDGVLVITAPKMKPIVHEGERAVPITMKS